jgi:ssDNA-binding Zn-finger/Zn-ribbon topoisomerase 1
MKVMKKVTKEVEEIDDMICNKCGKTLKQILSKYGDYNFCGLEEVKMVCGYGSENDGTIFTFSICEECVLEMMAGFQIPPEEKEEEKEYLF